MKYLLLTFDETDGWSVIDSAATEEGASQLAFRYTDEGQHDKVWIVEKKGFWVAKRSVWYEEVGGDEAAVRS